MKFGMGILGHILIDSGYGSNSAAYHGGQNCSIFKMAAISTVMHVSMLIVKLAWILKYVRKLVLEQY